MVKQSVLEKPMATLACNYAIRMSTLGQKRKFESSDEQSFKRLLHAKTCQAAYVNKSASAAVRDITASRLFYVKERPLIWIHSAMEVYFFQVAARGKR